MKTIKIGFSRAKSKTAWLSKLIMFCEKAPYSHVYVQAKSKSLSRDLIYQASGLAVNFMGTAVFDNHALIVKEYELDITDATYKKLMQFAIDNAGKKYGIKQLIGIGIVMLAKVFGIQISNPFSDGRQTYVCAELVGVILNDLIDLNIMEDLDTIGPKEIDIHLNEFKEAKLVFELKD